MRTRANTAGDTWWRQGSPGGPSTTEAATARGSKAAAQPALGVTAGPDGPRTPVGLGRRRYGTDKGEAKLTYETPLPSVLHEADGYKHEHHLGADDGTVYQLNRPILSGARCTSRTCSYRWTWNDCAPDGEYFLRLTLQGQCPYEGPFTVSYDLRRTELDSAGHLPWRSIVANIRVVPDDLVDLFGSVYGQRNQIESRLHATEAA